MIKFLRASKLDSTLPPAIGHVLGPINPNMPGASTHNLHSVLGTDKSGTYQELSTMETGPSLPRIMSSRSLYGLGGLFRNDPRKGFDTMELQSLLVV